MYNYLFMLSMVTFNNYVKAIHKVQKFEKYMEEKYMDEKYTEEKYTETMTRIKNDIPPDYTSEWAFPRRIEFINKYGWCLVSDEAIQFIVKITLEFGGSLLSVGSGDLAVVESLLAFFDGIEVYATDDFSSHGSTKRRPVFSDSPLMNEEDKENTVHDLDAITAINRFVTRVLFLGWPPMSSMAVDAAKAFRLRHEESECTDPIVLIFWGEGEYGCNADQNFFAELGLHWEEYSECETLRFGGIYDSLRVYIFYPKINM